MKITGRKSQPIAPLSPLGGAPAPEQSASADEAAPAALGDQVDLGSTSQIRQLAETAKALPTVRTEKVEVLRGAIDEGSYYVESDKLARKVVDEALNDILAEKGRR